MNGSRIELAVARPWGEEIAIVRADVAAEMNEDEFLKRLTRAVTAWVKETEEGRHAWDISSEDFNVGDLSHDVGNEPLVSYLAGEGIANLSVEPLARCSSWLYDTILVDASKIEKAEESK